MSSTLFGLYSMFFFGFLWSFLNFFLRSFTFHIYVVFCCCYFAAFGEHNYDVVHCFYDTDFYFFWLVCNMLLHHDCWLAREGGVGGRGGGGVFWT